MEPPSIDSTLTPSLFPELAYDHDEDDDEEEDEVSSEESETSGNETNSEDFYEDEDGEILEDTAPEEDQIHYEDRSNSYTSNAYDDDENGDVGVFNPASATTPQKSNSNYRYSIVGGIFGCCYGYTCFAIVFFTVLIVGSVVIKMAIDNGGSSSPKALAPTPAPPGSGPAIAIPTSPSKDLFCPNEYSRFEGCLAGLGSSQERCEACFNDAKDATEIAASCERINYHLCTGIQEKCPAACQTCAGEFDEWNACFFNATGTCQVNCKSAPQKEPEAYCEDQIVNYRTCLDGIDSTSAAACVDCVNGAIRKADQQVMCSAFHSDFCTAFGKCEVCGGCMDYMEEWMHCMTVTFNKCNAGIDCDKPKEPCDDEMVSYHSCLGSFTSGTQLQSCLDCVRDSFQNAVADDSNLCNDIQESFCAGFDACDDCGGNGSNGCRNQAETYVSCLVTTNGCSAGLDCERQPDPCSSQINGYQACLAKIGNQDDVRACRNCVNTAVETHQSAECGAFNDGFCSDFQLCDTCQTCAKELNSFVTCRMLNTWDCSSGLNCAQTGPK